MTPEEKPSSAERAAEAYSRTYPFSMYGFTIAANGFLAGAEWKAAQVAEAVGKLERVRDMLDASFSFDQYVRELDAALALLKEGTK